MMATNRQRAGELWAGYGAGLRRGDLVNELASALDDAEQRGAERVAQRMRGLLAEGPKWLAPDIRRDVADWLTAWLAKPLAEPAPPAAGQEGRASVCGCRTHGSERCAELGCECTAEDFAAYDPAQFDYDDETGMQ